MSKQVTVIGGGITGLSAAYHLHRKGRSVAVYEAGDRLGGKIWTGEFARRPFEFGADAFLTRVPWAKDRAEELGLNLVAPATSSASVAIDSVLKPMPMGPILGLPRSIKALLASGILSFPQAARAYLDLVLPGTRQEEDLSLAAMVERRLGRAVVDRFTDPLLAGIYAGNTRELSATSVAPQLVEFASKHRSFLKGLTTMPSSPKHEAPFNSVQGGLSRLVDGLSRDLPAVHLSTKVDSLDRFESVILTCPAFESARLLQTVSPQACAELSKIRYASVGLICFAFAPGDRWPSGSGFLVPRRENRLITACTFYSQKWATVGAEVLVRCSVGRIDDERWVSMDESKLQELVLKELCEISGVKAKPLHTETVRWTRSLPQYNVGHAGRVARIRDLLPPGISVAGAAFDGVGIPACIRQGQLAADQIDLFL